MQKYWKKAITTVVIAGGIAAGGGYIHTIATKLQHNLASLLQNTEDTVPNETQLLPYSSTSSTTNRTEKHHFSSSPSEQQQKYSFHDALKIALFTNTLHQDILMMEEPEFVPRIKAKDYGLAELCTGACVYVEMRGGYAKYDLQYKETTFTHKVCDEDNEGKSFCNFEVYTMDRYYLVINKEGEINDFGKIASSQDANDANDYVTVFNEEEYNNPDYNKDKEVEIIYYP